MQVFLKPKSLLYIGVVLLVAYAIYDCWKRKEHPFWMAIILLFAPVWGLGPFLYLAWTRNWLGKMTDASDRRQSRRAEARIVDVPGIDTPAALHKRAQVLIRQGKYQEAIKLLEEVLVREGSSVPHEVRFDIAAAYKAIERYRDARDQLSMIVGDDPQFRTGQAFLELADCHYQMNENKKAMDMFRQLLKYIRFPEARYKYAVLLDNEGETSAAVEQMNLLISEIDNAPDFHRHNNRKYAKLAKKYLKAHR